MSNMGQSIFIKKIISRDEAMELCVTEAAQFCTWGCAPNWELQCSPEEDASGWDFGESIVPAQTSLFMLLSAKISHWHAASPVWKLYISKWMYKIKKTHQNHRKVIAVIL